MGAIAHIAAIGSIRCNGRNGSISPRLPGDNHAGRVPSTMKPSRLASKRHRGPRQISVWSFCRSTRRRATFNQPRQSFADFDFRVFPRARPTDPISTHQNRARQPVGSPNCTDVTVTVDPPRSGKCATSPRCRTRGWIGPTVNDSRRVELPGHADIAKYRSGRKSSQILLSHQGANRALP